MSDWLPPGIASMLSDPYGLKKKEEELKDKYGEWEASLKNVIDTEMPSAPDMNPWIQSMSSLTGQLSAGPGQFVDEATAYRARMMGYEDITNPDGTVTTAAQQYQNDLQNMRGFTMDQAQGLSEEERSMMERNKASSIQGMEEQAQRQFESIMGDRGGMGALSAADEFRKQVSDTNLQYDMQIMEADFSKKLIEVQRNDERMGLQISQGNALASDYLQLRQQGIMDALGGVMGQAQLQLQEYGAQLQAVTTHAELIYKAAMLEIGADESIMNQLSEYYEQMIAPTLLEMQQQELDILAGDKFWEDVGTLLGLVGAAGTLLGLLGL